MTIGRFNSSSSNSGGCDLCGGSCFELVSSTDRHGKELETVLCQRCGLVQHARIPSDEQLAEFYGRRYRESYHGETTPSDRRVMRAWHSAERIYGRLKEHADSTCRVVEIGAGIGCTVKRFQNAGYQSWGVEPHRGFCRYGQQQLGADVRNQDLAEIDACGDNQFALLIHVIEHFNSPRRALLQIRDLLSPEGLLYVECPNLSAPFARRSKMFHFAHIHTFSPATLTSLARQCGFQVEHVFSQPRSANLEMLFRRSEAGGAEIDPAGYREAKLGLARAGRLRYYLRRSYIQQRAERLTAYVREFIRARVFVAGIRTSVVPDAAASGPLSLADQNAADSGQHAPGPVAIPLAGSIPGDDDRLNDVASSSDASLNDAAERQRDVRRAA